MENPENRTSSSSNMSSQSEARTKLVKLKSRSREKLNTSASSKVPSTFKPPENWANAPEFVPSWLAASGSAAPGTRLKSLCTYFFTDSLQIVFTVITHN